MRAFQLDECFNDKKIAAACNDGGRCLVRRYPNRLKQQKDYVMLPDLLRKDAPIVTRDFRILFENSEFIPEFNSGMIVSRSKYPNKPFTGKAASINIERLKQKFPDWFNTDWSGLYIEIDEEGICVGRLCGYDHQEAHSLSFNHPQFAAELASKLELVRRSLPRVTQITGE